MWTTVKNCKTQARTNACTVTKGKQMTETNYQKPPLREIEAFQTTQRCYNQSLAL